MKKLGCAIVLLSLLAIVLIGCGGKTGKTAEAGGGFDPAKIRIAYVGNSLNHPTIRLWTYGFEKACKELGYTQAKVIGTEGGDFTEAYVACESFLAEGGDAMCFPLFDPSGYTLVERAGTMGMKVFSPHTNLLDENGKLPPGMTFCIGPDHISYSKAAAEAMAKALKGKKGSIAISQSELIKHLNDANAAFQGRWNELVSEYDLGGIRILPTHVEGIGSVDQSINTNLSLIQATRDLIGVYGLTGGSAITWGDAAARAGKAPGEICIIGMDATEGNLDYLESGRVYALVAQPCFEEFYEGMHMMDKVLRGGTVPLWTEMESPIVTKDGTGTNGIEYHRKIVNEAKAFYAGR